MNMPKMFTQQNVHLHLNNVEIVSETLNIWLGYEIEQTADYNQ